MNDVEKPKKKVRILSLDGGGIRGVIPAVVLQYVEKELVRKTQNYNARIADYFDMLIGTSTGGVLACYYLIPNESQSPSSRFDASTALEIYTTHGGKIFNEAKRKSWFGIRQLFDATRYSAKNLERIFQDVFGELKYHELLKPCILTAYDMATGKAVFFNSREPLDKLDKRKFYAKDVVRSTSAAPTYFSPAIIKNLATGDQMVNLDGGVFANNPSMCAYAEARKTNFDYLGINRPVTAEDMLILSIGTGSMPLDIKNHHKSKKWGIINWAKTVPEIMMDGGLDTVNYQMDKIFKSLDEEYQKNYKRINVPESMRFPDNPKQFKPPYNPDMSDASPKNIEALTQAGNRALEAANQPKPGEHTLDQIIDELIAMQDEHWIV